MKYLLLVLIASNVFSAYVKISTVADEKLCMESVKHLSQEICEQSGEECLELSFEDNCAYLTTSKQMTSNMEAPIWGTRSKITSCSGEEDCAEKREILVCTGERSSYVNAEFTEIWCNELLGYEQVETGKHIVAIDEDKKAIYEAAEAAKALEAQIIAKGKLDRSLCQKALDYVIGLNSLLTQVQRDAMAAEFVDIYSRLQKNQREEALALITAKEVDSSKQPLKDKLIEILTIN